MDVTHVYTHEFNGCIIKLDENIFRRFDGNTDCQVQAACLPHENAAFKVSIMLNLFWKQNPDHHCQDFKTKV